MGKSAKCKYCKWYKAGGVWTSICTNSNSIYDADECVEQIGAESEPCDDREDK